MKRALSTGLFVAAIIIGVISVQLTSRPATPSDSATAIDSPAVVDGSTSQPTSVSSILTIGDASAPLTITEYGDFQCPICKNFFDNAGAQIRKNYVDTGKAKIEFRVETHIGAESAAAGEAAWCANDQGKFPAYHDELYRRQKGANSGTFSSANLKKIASDVGLDRAKFDGCLDGGAYRQKVIDGHNESRARISSTPTFFIGDQKIVGAQSYAVFKTIIDSKL